MQQEIIGIKEAVGVFDTIDSLNQAVAELETTAFPRHDISVLGSAADNSSLKTRSLEDNPVAPRAILIRPEELTIGLGVIIGGGVYAGVVTAMLMNPGPDTAGLMAMMLLGGILGGALGGVVAWLLGYYYQSLLQHKIMKGGMILWVRTQDRAKEKLAHKIMKRHGGRHIHTHTV